MPFKVVYHLLSTQRHRHQKHRKITLTYLLIWVIEDWDKCKYWLLWLLWVLLKKLWPQMWSFSLSLQSDSALTTHSIHQLCIDCLGTKKLLLLWTHSTLLAMHWLPRVRYIVKLQLICNALSTNIKRQNPCTMYWVLAKTISNSDSISQTNGVGVYEFPEDFTKI